MSTNETPPVTRAEIGYGILASSGYPDTWAYKASGPHGHAWGTADSQREAMRKCIEYLTHLDALQTI